MTVESQASDDKCGSIAIVQETQHTVIHINSSVNPGAMREVCRELRLGYRSVVKELTQTKSELGAQLQEMKAFGHGCAQSADHFKVEKNLVRGMGDMLAKCGANVGTFWQM
jgi:hypothetical protein